MKKIICSIMLILFACAMISMGKVYAETNVDDEWVEATIVIPESDSLISPLINFPAYGEITGDGVNLRAAASFSGTVLELMYRGELVYINYDKSSGSWLYIKRAKTGRIGYVYKTYVSDQS